MNPQNSGHDPYEFIMSSGKPEAKKPLGLNKLSNNKNSLVIKIGLIVSGAVVLMIVAAIVVNSLTGSKTNTADLQTLAATQTEIARVAGLGAEGGSTQQAVKNFAQSTQLALLTQQQTTVNVLGTEGVKLKGKQLAAAQDSTTDTKLQDASSSSTFDPVFIGIMKEKLSSYLTDLENYYKNSQNNTVKSMLQTDFQQTQLLQQQLPSATTSTSS